MLLFWCYRWHNTQRLALTATHVPRSALIYMLSTGDKVRIAREARRPKVTQATLASETGITRAKIAAWEANRFEPRAEDLKRVARYLKVPVQWFYSEDMNLPVQTAQTLLAPGFTPPAPYADRESHPKVGRRLFPLVGSAGAAQFPIESEGATEEDFVEFADALWTDSARRFAIRVRGDSMEPELRHGDFVLVHPDPAFRLSGFFVVVQHNYEYLVKVLVRDENRQLVLAPLNKDYDPIPIDEDGWEMVGWVCGRKRERGSGAYLEEGDNAGLRPEKL